jgi:DNA-binding beta-propeller fold protein YncE
MKKEEIWITLGILALVVLLLWALSDRLPRRNSANPVSYEVVRQWKLPEELEEISGISWLPGNRLAAVQDEYGIILVFGLDQGKILEEIPFAEQGDFEAVAINGKNAYALRSDGVIFEVLDFESGERKVKSYKTPFSIRNNMESLALDGNGSSLLLTPKNRDLESGGSKGIYSFSLDSKELEPQPVFGINLEDAEFIANRPADMGAVFRPSDMAVHPVTGEIYIVDGVIPQLLIMDDTGIIKDVYPFSEEFFPQPEGIAFSPDGTLFIANEGEKDVPATITQLKLN